jgi:HTH-type transcriptional regulator/antitoxin HigA
MTEAEYEQALARIEALMDARPRSPELDELKRLCALVEIYEQQHYPIDEPSPADAATFRAEQEEAV